MSPDEKSKLIIFLQQMLEDSREQAQASEQRAEMARAIARENRVRIECFWFFRILFVNLLDKLFN